MTHSANVTLTSDKTFYTILLMASLFLATLQNLALNASLSTLIFTLIALTPLAYLAKKRALQNRYTLLVIPCLAIWSIDLFIYNNTLAQTFLPTLLIGTIAILYLSCMHNVEYFYQIFIPRLNVSIIEFSYVSEFYKNMLLIYPKGNIFKRLGISFLITMPVFWLFLALFREADVTFDAYVTQMMTTLKIPSFKTLFYCTFYFCMNLMLFTYSSINYAKRTATISENSFDTLIVTIFLSTLNLLFFVFLLFQMSYLFGGEAYLKEVGITPSHFARQGFFQFAFIIGCIVMIFLLIMYRYKGERPIKITMSVLMAQTIILGIASIKKMNLYQAIYGATTLRYYVEWFEYFLIAILGISIIFTLFEYSFHRLLSWICALGLISFTLVASLNIDEMIASNHAHKMALSHISGEKRSFEESLSLDAYPILRKITFDPSTITMLFNDECESLFTYHMGRCMILSRYKEEILQHYEERNARFQTNAKRKP